MRPCRKALRGPRKSCSEGPTGLKTGIGKEKKKKVDGVCDKKSWVILFSHALAPPPAAQPSAGCLALITILARSQKLISIWARQLNCCAGRKTAAMISVWLRALTHTHKKHIGLQRRATNAWGFSFRRAMHVSLRERKKKKSFMQFCLRSSSPF